MTPIEWQTCNAEEQRALLTRPAISASENISASVREILEKVKAEGDEALRFYSAAFDKTTVAALRVTNEEIDAASARLGEEIKQAMAVAVA
ncbi:histidinol dehydrogenase, partial [Kalamiella sp. sgz302252]|uniref:histidinol dehydrogenase n=1 Tax=Pantoea sp. sgz302252 TaxID=3341827 RepID=UPI0036D31350